MLALQKPFRHSQAITGRELYIPRFCASRASRPQKIPRNSYVPFPFFALILSAVCRHSFLRKSVQAMISVPVQFSEDVEDR